MATLKSLLRRAAAQVISRALPRGILTHPELFAFWERRGIHMLPVHYDSPIPNTGELDGSLWTRYSSLPGIELGIDRQLALLERFAAAYKAEYDAFARAATADPHRYHSDQPWFSWIDAAILHGMIRHHRPRRMIEIGSGFSTLVSAAAIRLNAASGSPCELTAIEPYSNQSLLRGLPGLTRLIAEPVQAVPLEEFLKLEAGDFLFIDSSHVARIGSDVLYEYLEILPRLNPGVFVHAHDIFMPWEYPPEWVKQGRVFWNEQYLLQAFLAFNDAFEVVWAANFMNQMHPGPMQRAFSFIGNPTRPAAASFWMRKTR